jgi:hypothetical protein
MKDKYIKDLQEVKEMMNRSSRFISLSGLSGVSAGFIALIGAYMAYHKVLRTQDYYSHANLSTDSLIQLLSIGITTLVLAIGSTIYFTTRETKKRNQEIWDHQTKRLLINLFIPLLTGGIVCLMFLFKGNIGLIAPLMLIFYGLALVNASKYTLDVVRKLGLIEIVLGLIAMQFIGHGLLFWAIGFGIIHIVYGLIIHWKYSS